jgi:putative ABC transport system ATP-binding protein
LYSI